MRIRAVVVALLAGGLLALAASFAFAYPSLNGPTGLATLPSAEVLSPGQIDLAVNYLGVKGSDLGGDVANALGQYMDKAYNAQAVIGIQGNAELWALVTDAQGSDLRIYGAGGKIQLMREPVSRATVAIGAGLHRVQNSGDQNVVSAYVVATKDFTRQAESVYQWEQASGAGLKGSAGLLYVDYGDLGDHILRPFLGLEMFNGPSSLVVEYRFEDKNVDNQGVFGVALRHSFDENLSGTIGFTNGGLVLAGTDKSYLFLGLAYRLGAGQKVNWGDWGW